MLGDFIEGGQRLVVFGIQLTSAVLQNQFALPAVWVVGTEQVHHRPVMCQVPRESELFQREVQTI